MADIRGTNPLKKGEKFTLADRDSWPDNERWELINGEAFDMSPSPRTRHQQIVLSLASKLVVHLNGKPCQPFSAPLDVFLVDDQDPDTVVQPDVLVVCDETKIQENGIHGAPDFVAEILSDSTAYKDLGRKKELYERTGVREYWIINPDSSSVFVYARTGTAFAPATEVRKGTTVPSSAIPGFSWLCP